MLGSFEVNLIIERCQCLHWRVRPNAPDRGGIGSWSIVDGKVGIRRRSFPKRVDPAAITVTTVCRWPDEPAMTRLADPRRLWRKCTGAPNFLVDQPGAC